MLSIGPIKKLLFSGTSKAVCKNHKYRDQIYSGPNQLKLSLFQAPCRWFRRKQYWWSKATCGSSLLQRIQGERTQLRERERVCVQVQVHAFGKCVCVWHWESERRKERAICRHWTIVVEAKREREGERERGRGREREREGGRERERLSGSSPLYSCVVAFVSKP